MSPSHGTLWHYNDSLAGGSLFYRHQTDSTKRGLNKGVYYNFIMHPIETISLLIAC